MLNRFVLLALSLVIVAGCGGGNTEVFTRADGEEIRSMLQEFSETLGENDASALLGDYSGNAVVMPPNSSTVRGPESIEGFFGALFSEGKASLVLEPRDLEAEGTLALINGSYILEIAAEGDSEGQRDRGKFAWLFRKLQGQWYIQQQIWNSDLPPRVPSEPKEEEEEQEEE